MNNNNLKEIQRKHTHTQTIMCSTAKAFRSVIIKKTFPQNVPISKKKKHNAFSSDLFLISMLKAPPSTHWRMGPVSLGGGGAEVSCAIFIFYPPVLARKLSGLIRILLAFLSENGHLKISGGGGGAASYTGIYL